MRSEVEGMRVSQWVHAAVWYILRLERDPRTMALGPVYALYWYLDLLDFSRLIAALLPVWVGTQEVGLA